MPVLARLGTISRWKIRKTIITGTVKKITPAMVTEGRS
jgi:hypothetical protein